MSPAARSERGVVVAGAGLAAQRCAETLRRCGYDGRIRIVGEEPLSPYDRPPLSKGVLAGKIDWGALSYRQPSWYAEQQVELLLGRRAVALEPAMRRIRIAGGEEDLLYHDLLIATGSTPRRLPGTEGFANVHVLRTAPEARALRAALEPGVRLTVVGAGFIGQEVAATARSLGVEVTIIEAAGAPLATVLGEELGCWFADLHREEGVRVLLSTTVSEFRGGDRVEEIELGDGRRLPCDVVVVGIGVTPATSWLRGSGLPQDGVPVGSDARTALPHVYAAGDASLPFHEGRGTHVRSEHWESAARMGAAAARAMLGLELRPSPPSSFWSDQYGLRIQYVGHAQGADQVEIDGCPSDRDFTAVFSSAGSPVGALLVGRPRELPRMRRLIESGSCVRDLWRREPVGSGVSFSSPFT